MRESLLTTSIPSCCSDNSGSEIDKFGFGKYQWCIWMLCGFGFFLDLAWSQGVGLLATAV
jgi:hypothetical protein